MDKNFTQPKRTFPKDSLLKKISDKAHDLGKKIYDRTHRAERAPDKP